MLAGSGWDVTTGVNARGGRTIGGGLRGQHVGNSIYKDIGITKDHDGRVFEKGTGSQEVKSSRHKSIDLGFGR